MTVNNSSKYLDKDKNYIMFSSGHAIGVKNGIVEDWSRGSKRPIRELYCVTPPVGQEVEVLDSRKLLIQEVVEAEAMIKLLGEM
jgi:hypothetical protein